MDTRGDWARCRGWIEAAVATGPGVETIDDVERLVGEGRYQLFTAPRSAAVTEIAQFTRRRILIVVHGGGDLEELLDVLEPRMCAFACAEGCDAIMGTGRRGWDRVTKKRGYRFAWINMIKDLRM